jgi:hypothetical protein
MHFHSALWKRIHDLGIVPVEVPKVVKGEDAPKSLHNTLRSTSIGFQTETKYVYNDDIYYIPSLPENVTDKSNIDKTGFSPEAEQLR